MNGSTKTENADLQSLRLAKNTLYNVVGNTGVHLINFLLIPYIVHRLGIELYGGVWMAVVVMTSYVTLLDLGIGTAFVKYIAELEGRNARGEINRYVSTGLVFYALYGLVVGIVTFVFGKPLLSLIGVPAIFLHDAHFVLMVMTLSLVIVNGSLPVTAGLVALQRMDLSNLVMIAQSLLGLAQTIFVLEMGWGVRGLAVGTLLVNGAVTVISIYLVYRLLPALSPTLKEAGKEVFRILVRYGSNIQISKISQVIVFQTDRLIALRFFGSTMAGLYELASKATGLARAFPLVLTSALVPAVSEMNIKGEHGQVNIISERWTKYLVVVGAVFLGFVFCDSELLMAIWMGPELGAEEIFISSIVMKLLAVGYFVNMSTGAVSSVAAGIGRTDLERRVGVFLIIATPILALVGVALFQYNGIPLAMTAALSLGGILYIMMYARMRALSPLRFWSQVWRPCIGVIAATGTVTAGRMLVQADVSSRLMALLHGAADFAVFGAVLGLCLYFFRVFDEGDKQLIRAILHSAKQRWRITRQ